MTRHPHFPDDTSGVCQNVDPLTADMWFSGDPDDQRLAMRGCATCPLIEPCTRYALAHDERFGIWGGWQVVSSQERATARRWLRYLEQGIDVTPDGARAAARGAARLRRRSERVS